jgi:hypothetical protein
MPHFVQVRRSSFLTSSLTDAVVEPPVDEPPPDTGLVAIDGAPADELPPDTGFVAAWLPPVAKEAAGRRSALTLLAFEMSGVAYLH